MTLISALQQQWADLRQWESVLRPEVYDILRQQVEATNEQIADNARLANGESCNCKLCNCVDPHDIPCGNYITQMVLNLRQQ